MNTTEAIIFVVKMALLAFLAVAVLSFPTADDRNDDTNRRE